MEIKIGAKYKHFKGNEYRVIGVAKHSETLEELVVYQGLYEGGEMWARPKNLFLEKVDINGEMVPRFKLL